MDGFDVHAGARRDARGSVRGGGPAGPPGEQAGADTAGTGDATHELDGLAGCRIVDLPVVHDRRGNLTALEAGREVPFDIRRVYYLYDVPGGEERAGHAHHELQQLVIAASGSFDVLLDDGTTRRTVTLRRAYHGLLITQGVWREIHNFSSGSVCLVLASLPFDEADYIRDYAEYRRLRAGGELPADLPPVDRRSGTGQFTR